MVEKRTAELDESGEKFRAIFDQTAQLMAVLDTDGYLVEVNRPAMKMGGVEGKDVIGRPFWEGPWWRHSRELQQHLRDAVKRAANGEHVRFEAIHPTVEGQERIIDFSLTPVVGEDGKIVLKGEEGPWGFNPLEVIPPVLGTISGMNVRSKLFTTWGVVRASL